MVPTLRVAVATVGILIGTTAFGGVLPSEGASGATNSSPIVVGGDGDLGLAPGVAAVASVKATNVTVELPATPQVL